MTKKERQLLTTIEFQITGLEVAIESAMDYESTDKTALESWYVAAKKIRANVTTLQDRK